MPVQAWFLSVLPLLRSQCPRGRKATTTLTQSWDGTQQLSPWVWSPAPQKHNSNTKYAKSTGGDGSRQGTKKNPLWQLPGAAGLPQLSTLSAKTLCLGSLSPEPLTTIWSADPTMRPRLRYLTFCPQFEKTVAIPPAFSECHVSASAQGCPEFVLPHLQVIGGSDKSDRGTES